MHFCSLLYAYCSFMEQIITILYHYDADEKDRVAFRSGLRGDPVFPLFLLWTLPRTRKEGCARRASAVEPAWHNPLFYRTFIDKRPGTPPVRGSCTPLMAVQAMTLFR